MLGIPDRTQEKLHDQIAASMDILLHTKRKLSTFLTVLGILKFKKLCNLIELKNYIFHIHVTFIDSQR